MNSEHMKAAFNPFLWNPFIGGINLWFDSLNATSEATTALLYYNQALTRYTNELSAMYLSSLRSFSDESLDSAFNGDPASALEFSELMQANMLTFSRIMSRAWTEAFGRQLDENLHSVQKKTAPLPCA